MEALAGFLSLYPWGLVGQGLLAPAVADALLPPYPAPSEQHKALLSLCPPGLLQGAASPWWAEGLRSLALLSHDAACHSANRLLGWLTFAELGPQGEIKGL